MWWCSQERYMPERQPWPKRWVSFDVVEVERESFCDARQLIVLLLVLWYPFLVLPSCALVIPDSVYREINRRRIGTCNFANSQCGYARMSHYIDRVQSSDSWSFRLQSSTHDIVTFCLMNKSWLKKKENHGYFKFSCEFHQLCKHSRIGSNSQLRRATD